MSAENLRKHLAKVNLEKQRLAAQDSRSPLENPEIWRQAREAMRSGWSQPESRLYIIISPNTFISTPEKLQEIARMTSPPRVITTVYTGLHGGNPRAPQMQGDGKPQEVTVGEVGRKEFQEIRSKTECDVSLFVMINEESRGAFLVKGPKKVEAKPDEELLDSEWCLDAHNNGE